MTRHRGHTDALFLPPDLGHGHRLGHRARRRDRRNAQVQLEVLVERGAVGRRPLGQVVVPRVSRGARVRDPAAVAVGPAGDALSGRAGRFLLF